MKTLAIIASVMVFLFLAAPSRVVAQNTSSVAAAAEKSWKPFWTQFTAAVKSKNKAAIKHLMVAERDFSNGTEGGTRNQWLENLDKQKLWREVQRTVAKGTKLYNSGEKRPWRVTTDDSFLFVFEKRSWRFFGVMGDE